MIIAALTQCHSHGFLKTMEQTAKSVALSP
jgi:hypothetical protein